MNTLHSDVIFHIFAFCKLEDISKLYFNLRLTNRSWVEFFTEECICKKFQIYYDMDQDLLSFFNFVGELLKYNSLSFFTSYKPTEKKLLKAAKIGSLYEFKIILILSKDLDIGKILGITDRNGSFLMHVASRYGKLDVCKHLYAMGFDLLSYSYGEYSDIGYYPIHDAVENDHVEVVKWMDHINPDLLYAKVDGTLGRMDVLNLALDYASILSIIYIIPKMINVRSRYIYNKFCEQSSDVVEKYFIEYDPSADPNCKKFLQILETIRDDKVEIRWYYQ